MKQLRIGFELVRCADAECGGSVDWINGATINLGSRYVLAYRCNICGLFHDEKGRPVSVKRGGKRVRLYAHQGIPDPTEG